jgi:hypothetical protein
VEAAAEAEVPASPENASTAVSRAGDIEAETADAPMPGAAENQLPVTDQTAREPKCVEPGVDAGSIDASKEDDLPVESAAGAGNEQVAANTGEIKPSAAPATDSVTDTVFEASEPQVESGADVTATGDTLPASTEESTAAIELPSDEPAMDFEADGAEPEMEPVLTTTADKSPEILPGEQVSASDNGKNGNENKSAFEWNCLGNVYLKAGSYDEAISAYTRAIEMAPKVGWPYRNLASAYFYKGMTAVAIPLYKRSIDLLSNNAEKAASLNKLGDAYRQLGDYQNAMVAYQKADDLTAGINSLLNRARMLVSNSGQD